MWKIDDFRISKNVGWYAFVKESKDDYLLKPGIVMNWYEAVKKYGSENANKKVHFSSKEELEKCLQNYLKGEKMNETETKLEQNKRDIEALLQEQVKLKKELKEQVPEIRHGDYGYWYGYKFDPVIFEQKYYQGALRITNKSTRLNYDISDENKRKFVKVGNLFDDLKGK